MQMRWSLQMCVGIFVAEGILRGQMNANKLEGRKKNKQVSFASVPLASTTVPNFSESAEEKVAGKGERKRHYRRKTTKALPNLSSGAVGDN